MTDRWNNYGDTPDDVPSWPPERDYDDSERPRYMHKPMTLEQIRKACEGMPMPQLGKRQAD